MASLSYGARLGFCFVRHGNLCESFSRIKPRDLSSFVQHAALSTFQIKSAERFISNASRSRSARRRTEGRDEASADYGDGGRSAKVKDDEEEEKKEVCLENNRPCSLFEGMRRR